MKIIYTIIYQDIYCIYQYILVHTIIHTVTPSQDFEEDIVTPLCGAMRDVSQPPVEQEPEDSEKDPSPCPEDEEFFVRPDVFDQALNPSKNRFCTGFCASFDSARWGFPTQVVGVYLQDSTPCPALAAYKVG
jgi:hypothetical protein